MTSSIFKHFWWDIKKKQYRFDIIVALSNFFPGISGDLFLGIIWKYYVERCGGNFRVRRGCSLTNPQGLLVGTNVSINVGCYIDAGGGIIIGDNVLIGPSVKIWSVSHQFSGLLPINLQQKLYGKVEIGNGVWIGTNVVILPSVIIPDGVVIGSSSVVPANMELERYSVYAGIPVKRIKQRTST